MIPPARPKRRLALVLLSFAALSCSAPSGPEFAAEFCPALAPLTSEIDPFRWPGWDDVSEIDPFGWPGWDDVSEIAHRGGCCEAENTLEAIEASLARGVTAIEVDVRFTRDGVPVLMHDITLERTTNSYGDVNLIPLSRVRRVDACPKREGRCQVPTLAEALDATKGRAAVVLDMKDMRTCGRLMTVVRAIHRHGMWDRVAMISEEQKTLLMARQFSPSIPLGMYLSSGTTIEDPIGLARELGPSTEILVKASEVLNREGLFSTASSEDIPVIPWTAYSRTTLDRLISAPGVSRVLSAAPPLP